MKAIVAVAKFVWFLIINTILFWVGMLSRNSLANRLSGKLGSWMTNMGIAGMVTSVFMVGYAGILLLYPEYPVLVLRWLAVAYAAEMLVYFVLLTFVYDTTEDPDPWLGIVPYVLVWPLSTALEIWGEEERRAAWVLAVVGAAIQALLIGRAVCGILAVQPPPLFLPAVGWGWWISCYLIVWVVLLFVLAEDEPQCDH